MTDDSISRWPKIPPELSPGQKEAREKFMMLWHQILPGRYGLIEKFNHGWVASLPYSKGIKTLEVGAGIGAHAEWEDLTRQQYFFFEYRQEFCAELSKKFPQHNVIQGDIQSRQTFSDRSFDRVIAIHVLEHLPNLPLALAEISRLMRADAFLDIVIPCEGGSVYSLARRISAQRIFEKQFKMSYKPIIANEHLSQYDEIVCELKKFFVIHRRQYFPFRVPIAGLNLCVGMRLGKRSP